MQNHELRRTDRVSMPIRIQVVGSDPLGFSFVEQTVTVVVGRYGARIILKHSLTADQEITVRNLETGAETDMRVIGQVEATPEGYHYGVELLNPEVNIWGIGFPPLSESEDAVVKVLMECVRCHGRKLVYLNQFETEVFEAQRAITFPCLTCKDRTFWKRPPAEAPGAPAEAPKVKGRQPPSPRPVLAPWQEKRKNKRLALRLSACIRSGEHGDDVVTTLNVSKGGFGFKSAKRYALGMRVEVCVPYSPGPGNIFSAARIASARPLPNEGVFSYGVAYVRAQNG